MAESRLKTSPQVALDVIAAQATPPGESAVGMIRLSGSGCVQVASSFIRMPRHDLTPRMAVLAKAYDDGQPLDQVVVTYFPGPSSYTGEDMLEICTHGSPFIVSRTLYLLIAGGARPADPGEFTQRAYMHGRMDLAQAEAVGGLIRAKTRTAHRAAVNHLEGGLSSRIATMRSEILDLVAEVEADLDHPDDDLPAINAEELDSKIMRLRDQIAELSGTHHMGRLLMDGARIAIVGRPNVGKSSLLNALLGRDRAIVSPIPGTTRDSLEEWADLDGLQALFIDTAGLREKSSDSIERAGMERTRRAISASDLTLFVLDQSRPLEPGDTEVAKEISSVLDSEHRPVIIVLNKSDLPPRAEANKLERNWDTVAVSALRGSGLKELILAVSRKLASSTPAAEAGVIITSLRHRTSLDQAQGALDRARACLGQRELSAVHLRECLVSLGAIVGETTNEDILKSIFSKFCVGK